MITKVKWNVDRKSEVRDSTGIYCLRPETGDLSKTINIIGLDTAKINQNHF